MSQEQVANYVVLTIVVGALVIGLLSMLIGRIVAIYDWARDQMARAVARERSNMSSQDRKAPNAQREPERQRSNAFPLLNGAEPQFAVRETNANPANLQLNADEIAAVARMIEHNKTAAKPSKSSTIQAGFGVSRGGSEKYQRASFIYDTLFGPPTPAVKYRELTPDHQAQLN